MGLALILGLASGARRADADFSHITPHFQGKLDFRRCCGRAPDRCQADRGFVAGGSDPGIGARRAFIVLRLRIAPLGPK
jgi:hypothetical protein